MRNHKRNMLAIAGFVATVLPCPLMAQSEIIDGWTDLLLSASRLVIIGAAFIGILYSASATVRAYRAEDDRVRSQQMMAAFFAGAFTILGVIIGWVSGLLIPGGAG